jgi:hypothetical protein
MPRRASGLLANPVDAWSPVVVSFTTWLALPTRVLERAGSFLREWARAAESPGYRPGRGLVVAMLGDSTVRDFWIASGPRMLWQQWHANQNSPFLDTRAESTIESVFARVARRAPVRAVAFARSGAGVGPPRTRTRRWFQRFANVKTLSEQVDELAAEAELPHVTLVWIGHNNLDFVGEAARFSRSGDHTEIVRGIRAIFAEQLSRDLERLVRIFARSPRPRAVVVYGLVNPIATREARDGARARRTADGTSFPYLEKTEHRFPPLRVDHGAALAELSHLLSETTERVVSDLALRAPAHVRLLYSDRTARLALNDPDYLHPADAWHASDRGKRLIAEALYDGMVPALDFVGDLA